MEKWEVLRKKIISSKGTKPNYWETIEKLKKSIKLSSEYIVFVLLIKVGLLLYAAFRFLQHDYTVINVTVFLLSILSLLFYSAFLRNMLKRSEKDRINTDDFKHGVQSAYFLVFGAICGLVSGILVLINTIVAQETSSTKLMKMSRQFVISCVILLLCCLEVLNMFKAKQKLNFVKSIFVKNKK